MNRWGEDDFILSHEGSWIYLRSNEYKHPVVTIMNHPLVGPAQFPHNAGSGCKVCGCSSVVTLHCKYNATIPMQCTVHIELETKAIRRFAKVSIVS